MILPPLLVAPTVLEYFAALVDRRGFMLLEAAIAIAQDAYPVLDVQAVLADIDALAQRLLRRLPVDATPLQRLRQLNSWFFEHLGFAGNVNDFHDPRNSYLNDVISRRRGIPISLAMIYIELATQIGLTASGVSFPGHFMVRLRMPRGDVIIDPFSGRSLGRDELEDRLVAWRGSAPGPSLAEHLAPAPPRAVIARMLRNLRAIHEGQHDDLQLLAVMNRLVVLLPDDWDERRDRARVSAELGLLDDAVSDLAAYLSNRPDASDGVALRRDLRNWRARRSRRLHGRPGNL
jgi:regulator of sirC expression with transglutaminase-like and TPR domain